MKGEQGGKGAETGGVKHITAAQTADKDVTNFCRRRRHGGATALVTVGRIAQRPSCGQPNDSGDSLKAFLSCPPPKSLFSVSKEPLIRR